MVHAYLMYGYPTQSEQETIDSLEMVRQFFELGILQSAFWHQFALTAHSPIGLNPDKYGVIPHFNPISFANNDVEFTDKTNINHEKFGEGLRVSLYNYMHETGFDLPLQNWFNFKIPKTSIHPDYIYDAIHQNREQKIKSNARILWIGHPIKQEQFTKRKKGKLQLKNQLIIYTKTATIKVPMEEKICLWLIHQLHQFSVENPIPSQLDVFIANYESEYGNFDTFWNSNEMNTLKENGLLII